MVIVLTDGAFDVESSRASIGAAVLDPEDGSYLYYSAVLEQSATTELMKDSANPICAIEVLAVLVAVLVWGRRLAGRPCLGFVDNEPAKFALNRGSSAIVTVAALIDSVCTAEIAGRMLAWWERVPSASNLADPPSRLELPPNLPGWPVPSRTLIDESSPAVLLGDLSVLKYATTSTHAFRANAHRIVQGVRDAQ